MRGKQGAAETVAATGGRDDDAQDLRLVGGLAGDDEAFGMSAAAAEDTVRRDRGIGDQRRASSRLPTASEAAMMMQGRDIKRVPGVEPHRPQRDRIRVKQFAQPVLALPVRTD